MLDNYFLSSNLTSQLDWLCGIYGIIVAWNQTGRCEEYKNICNYLETTYDDDTLSITAAREYERLYHHYANKEKYEKQNENLKKRNSAELMCLKYISSHGKCPEIKDPKIEMLEIYMFSNDCPICLRDLIRCVTELAKSDLSEECKNYLESFKLSIEDYDRYCLKNKAFIKELANDYPQLINHLDFSADEL